MPPLGLQQRSLIVQCADRCCWGPRAAALTVQCPSACAVHEGALGRPGLIMMCLCRSLSRGQCWCAGRNRAAKVQCARGLPGCSIPPTPAAPTRPPRPCGHVSRSDGLEVKSKGEEMGRVLGFFRCVCWGVQAAIPTRVVRLPAGCAHARPPGPAPHVPCCSLLRCLLRSLACYGISAIVGGGIFVVTGLQAKNNAG